MEELRAELNKWYDYLETEIKKKNDYRKMEIIYVESEIKYFIKYNVDATIWDVLINSNFSHLSAVAYCALTLQHFGLPYKIYEYPTYVVIVGGLGKQQYKFDITDKEAGYWEFNENGRRAMLKMFEMEGLISNEQIQRLSPDSIYNMLMYRNGEISLLELAGLCYLNKANRLIQQGLYDSAYQFCRKAELLYPSVKIRYLKRSLVLDRFNGAGKEKSDDYFDMLALFDAAPLIDDEQVYRLTRAYLHDRILRDGQPQVASDLMSEMRKGNLNAELQRKISHCYYFLMSDYYNIKEQPWNAMKSSAETYSLMPVSPLSKLSMDNNFRTGFVHKSTSADSIKILFAALDTGSRNFIRQYNWRPLVQSRIQYAVANDTSLLRAEMELLQFMYHQDMFDDKKALISSLEDITSVLRAYKLNPTCVQLLQFAASEKLMSPKLKEAELALKKKQATAPQKKSSASSSRL